MYPPDDIGSGPGTPFIIYIPYFIAAILVVIYKLRSVQNTGICYLGLGWICQIHLGFSLSASAQVPDKPAFCTNLNLFYSIHFSILFIPLWVWLGTLQNYHHAQRPLALPTVIRIRLVIRQSNLPACLVEVPLALENNLWHLCHRSYRTAEIDRQN